MEKGSKPVIRVGGDYHRRFMLLACLTFRRNRRPSGDGLVDFGESPSAVAFIVSPRARSAPVTVLVRRGDANAMRRLDVQSRREAVWIGFKAIGFFLPARTDELIRGEARQALEPFGKVVSVEERAEVLT